MNALVAKNIQSLLTKLEDVELYGLAGTVTQNLLRSKLETREEALEVIVKYSPDTLSILRRKVVTRDILFSYLYENNVAVKLPALKNDLIEIILKHWNISTASETGNQIPHDQHRESVGDVNALALKFAEWFYIQMNGNDPISCVHFWEDANLKINLICGDNENREYIQNVDELVQKLYFIKKSHNLYFNPNVTNDGIQGRIDPHGLVAVLSCGTLHNNNACVGIFEQVFMLARDPFSENNWKIKRMELNLRSKEGVCALPTLRDNSLTNDMLTLPSS